MPQNGQSGLLLDVVIRKSSAILQLLSGRDQFLLFWGNALLVLNFAFDIFDGVRGFNLEHNNKKS